MRAVARRKGEILEILALHPDPDTDLPIGWNESHLSGVNTA